MNSNHFLFEPGEWLGAGQVSFTVSPDVLRFRTKWAILQQGAQSYNCIQTVFVENGDQIVNLFTVTPNNTDGFNIVLENQHLGTFTGDGILENALVGWEFREPGVFEGFEVYERVKEDEYSLHAEYLSSDLSRTTIRGKIWRKGEDEKFEV